MGCIESRPQSVSQEALNVNKGVKKVRGSGLEGKVVLLGDSGVGKSSLSLRFCQGRFPTFHEVTIGAAFLQQVIRLRDGSQIKLHIWDTGGQERFRSMSGLYYRDASGAILVYDCTDPATFESVKYWVDELRVKGPPNVVIVVAANKCDSANKLVDSEISKSYCRENGLVWVAKDEYENPKWTGVPKAAPMPISEYDTWNKQFGPTDPSKWAMTVAQRELVEEKMALKPEEAIIRTKTPTWE